jgi:hypothetical protein|nr:MAG TPA: hypothetical protein [Caudoviricetes sp.]
MEDFDKLKEKFINTLIRAMPYAKLHSGGKWVMFRCPYCFDSKKHKDTTHFNVSIPQSINDRVVMRCFQPECPINSTKIVKEDDLKLWGIYDIDIINFVKKLNSRNKKYTDDSFMKYKKLVNIPRRNNKLSLEKLEYINNRLGTNIKIEEVYKYKIILSFEEFLMQNNIKLDTNIMTDKMAYYLENNAIGFLSKDSTHIVFRDIHNKKYISYNISGTDEGMKFYSIPSKIDIIHKSKVYLAEGTFDILSAYMNLDTDKSNSIFVAVCGASYEYTIKQLIKNGFINTEFHIFSDKDVSYDYYTRMVEGIGKYKFEYPITIYYNELDKDIGVPRDKIKLIENKIMI